jgi:hypothetical protein
MLYALSTLHLLAILVVALIAFMLGGLWYSVLFGKMWMKEMHFTEEQMKSKEGIGRIFGGAFLLTLVSTITLATLIAAHRINQVPAGIEMGLFVGIGLVAARHATNALFEKRTLRHVLIVAGYDVTLCAMQGAILAVWR